MSNKNRRYQKSYFTIIKEVIHQEEVNILNTKLSYIQYYKRGTNYIQCHKLT